MNKWRVGRKLERERLFCRRFYLFLLSLKFDSKWNEERKSNKKAGKENGDVRQLVCLGNLWGTCSMSKPMPKPESQESHHP